MGNASEKKKEKDNAETLLYAKIFIAVCHSLYGVLRIFYHYDTFVGWPRTLYFATLAVTVFSYLWMAGSSGHVVAITECCSIQIDFLGTTNAAMVLSIFSDACWWLLIVIPMYGFYKLWVSCIWPWIQQDPGDGEPMDPNAPRSRKERRAAEREEKRRR